MSDFLRFVKRVRCYLREQFLAPAADPVLLRMSDLERRLETCRKTPESKEVFQLLRRVNKYEEDIEEHFKGWIYGTYPKPESINNFLSSLEVLKKQLQFLHPTA